MPEIFRALAVLCEPPGPQTSAIARALGIEGSFDDEAYTQLFVLSLYPYASVYLGSEGMLGGEARDRIAGFWRALQMQPPAEPDHLAALLGAYASLQEHENHASAEHRPSWEHARRAFLFEHLLSWLPVYLIKVEQIASPPYVAWGALLSDALAQAAHTAGTPELTPLHMRDVAGLADPREEGLPALIASLLAPARSGMILTRSDLSRAARELGLGLRQGERRFALDALLAQDPRGVLHWLALEAAHWGRLHRSRLEPGPARRHWAEQAENASVLLESLVASFSESHAFGT